ncbi:hypothetical protein DESUT3_13430 [Desulfuromonas versatilis]|uniref:N-acetyltransferase domain-containing protein n=1 Tax=Desulfuromonas versatilis TaxID=2802975 RepID=A0ABM8HUF2_9BACT|nr:putative beta-lysine N-acetyltransferase [Desulfuromonas versatilis]BCR04274.1 hypothetical protein DESUT3_13430 [Desulfuromonas versatilis]
MTPDAVVRLGDSLIQHGKANDRAYVMKVAEKDCAQIVDYAVSLALSRGYGKVFAKAPGYARRRFLDNGFVEEAKIPGFFRGERDGYFLSRFFCPDRAEEDRPELVSQVLEKAQQKSAEPEQVALPAGLVCRTMQKGDAEPMAELYRQVFASYPFPIHDPGYLARTMDENLEYYGILEGERLIALSSAEIDFAGKNAEMTDFATLPEARGKGLASYLLAKMEEGIRQIGIRTAYTIARAYSFGMNITFARRDYSFAGSLVNNTQISGDLESMNVWYKPL